MEKVKITSMSLYKPEISKNKNLIELSSSRMIKNCRIRTKEEIKCKQSKNKSKQKVNKQKVNKAKSKQTKGKQSKK